LTPPLFGGKALIQADASILIRMDEIRILKVDDPMSSDEPYLVNVGFRAQVAIGEESVPGIVPGTLSIADVGRAVHNNLGRNGDNWARRGNTYEFDSQLFGVVVPGGEPGWIVGVVSVLFEEDAYPNSTADDLRKRLREAVSEAIIGLSFDSVDTRGITRAVASQIVRDIQKGASRVNVGGIIRSLASAVDPDDFGGVNMVLAMTLPQNGLMMFAGSPPENLGALPTLTAVPSGGQTKFSLDFPQQIPGGVSWNARYRGKCKVSGAVIRGG
jgi:hypothetical protein